MRVHPNQLAFDFNYGAEPSLQTLPTTQPPASEERRVHRRDERLPPRGTKMSDEFIRVDPRWALWTQPLAEFMQKPREWAHLVAWGNARDLEEPLVRNMVVWMEEFRVAFSTQNEKGALVYAARKAG